MGCCLWKCEAADEAGRGSAFMWWYRPGSHAFPESYRISFFSDWPSLSNVSDIAMGSWKNHVRARLQERDLNEKVPFLGVYTSCTQILHLCPGWCYDACHDVDLNYLFIFSASAGGALRSSQTHFGRHIVREVWWICRSTAFVLET